MREAREDGAGLDPPESTATSGLQQLFWLHVTSDFINTEEKVERNLGLKCSQQIFSHERRLCFIF